VSAGACCLRDFTQSLGENTDDWDRQKRALALEALAYLAGRRAPSSPTLSKEICFQKPRLTGKFLGILKDTIMIKDRPYDRAVEVTVVAPDDMNVTNVPVMNRTASSVMFAIPSLNPNVDA
jgi:hypothetical protein